MLSWEWKPKYELNLRRLHKAKSLVELAAISGTFRDTPAAQDAASLVRGAGALINQAIAIQEAYKKEHKQ